MDNASWWIRPFEDLRGILLYETGYHCAKAVCNFAESVGVKKLVFVHKGREILLGKLSAKEEIEACGIPVIVSEDGMRIEIERA